MTTHVIARVASVDGRVADGAYLVGLDCWITDGGSIATTVGGNTFEVPFGSITKMNRVLRELLASYLATSWSVTIDPEDIYFPFS